MTDRIWRGDCNKWWYATRPEAMDRLIHIRKRRANGELNVPEARAVYRHAECGGWHLTMQIQTALMNNAPDIREQFFERGKDLRSLDLGIDTECKEERVI